MLNDRRQRKKNSTLQALLASATRLFAERGIYQTTIDEITSGADLGKGTFYKHFTSREELLAKVVRQGFDLLIADLDQELKPNTPIFAALLEMHTRFFAAHPEYLLIFHQTRGWLTLIKPEASPIQEEFRRYIQALADILLKVNPESNHTTETSLAVARFTAGAIAGVLSFEFTIGSGIKPDGSLEKTCENFSTLFATGSGCT